MSNEALRHFSYWIKRYEKFGIIPQDFDYKRWNLNFNLSDDEIKAIVKEIQDQQNQQQFQYIPPVSINMPTFITFDDFEANGNVAIAGPCIHEMVPYIGLRETYKFCKKCGEKEK